MIQEVLNSIIIDLASSGVYLMSDTCDFRRQDDPIFRKREHIYMMLRNILDALENYDLESGILSDNDIDYLIELAILCIEKCPMSLKGYSWISKTYKDYDGNIYHSIVIGTQEWMVENLKTTHYNDGTLIPNLIDNGDWSADTSGAWCYYLNDSANNKVFGKLYNWLSVNTGKLAPIGWHIPSYSDWEKLWNVIGKSIAGKKLKKSGAQYWFIDTGTNDYGFSAVAGGHRQDTGVFAGDGPPIDLDSCDLWTITEYNSLTAYYVQMNGGNDEFPIYEHAMIEKTMGMSVRCMRDV